MNGRKSKSCRGNTGTIYLTQEEQVPVPVHDEDVREREQNNFEIMQVKGMNSTENYPENRKILMKTPATRRSMSGSSQCHSVAFHRHLCTVYTVCVQKNIKYKNIEFNLKLSREKPSTGI